MADETFRAITLPDRFSHQTLLSANTKPCDMSASSIALRSTRSVNRHVVPIWLTKIPAYNNIIASF